MFSETDAPANGGAAPTSRTCCMELVEAKPRPQTLTPNAIAESAPAPNAQMLTPASNATVKISDVR